MSDAVLMLRIDHQNMAKVLRVLEEELHVMEAGKQPDLTLLESALQYLAAYPDQCHHPKEDLVFRQLSKRDPVAAGMLVNLVREHEELAKLTPRFAELVGRAIDAPEMSLEQLTHTMRHFIDYYWHHMTMEERHFFPTALRALKRVDWDEIDFSLFDRSDPVFDDAAEKRFKKLEDKIASVAQNQKERREAAESVRRDASRLQRLTSVLQFNDAMRDEGTDFHLIRFPEGSYGLESSGRPMVNIPGCGEVQAVWCAYYFMKGRDARDRFPKPA